MTKQLFRNSYSNTFKYKALIYAEKFKNMKEAAKSLRLNDANLYFWYKIIAKQINLNMYSNLEEALTPLIDQNDSSFENHLNTHLNTEQDQPAKAKLKEKERAYAKTSYRRRTNLSNITKKDVDNFIESLPDTTHPFYRLKWKPALYKLLENNNIKEISREFKISPVTLGHKRRELILFVDAQKRELEKSTLMPPLIISKHRSPDEEFAEIHKGALEKINEARKINEQKLQDDSNIETILVSSEDHSDNFEDLQEKLTAIAKEQQFLYQRVVDIMTTMNTIAKRQLETNEKLDKLGFLESLK